MEGCVTIKEFTIGELFVSIGLLIFIYILFRDYPKK